MCPIETEPEDHDDGMDDGMITDEPDYVEDSEYVGDSEYADNEYDQEDLPPCYADHPNYQQILALQDMEDPYELPSNLQVTFLIPPINCFQVYTQ